MHGGPKQIPFQTWRTGITLLQASEAARKVPMDTRGMAEALEDLKHHLQTPPILTAPLLGENLLHYITATTHVVSTVIVVERPEEGHAYGVQRPVYFVSEVLSESKV